jgi:hypothetical protein
LIPNCRRSEIAAKCSRLGSARRQNHTGPSSSASAAADCVTYSDYGFRGPRFPKNVKIIMTCEEAEGARSDFFAHMARSWKFAQPGKFRDSDGVHPTCSRGTLGVLLITVSILLGHFRLVALGQTQALNQDSSLIGRIRWCSIIRKPPCFPQVRHWPPEYLSMRSGFFCVRNGLTFFTILIFHELARQFCLLGSPNSAGELQSV